MQRVVRRSAATIAAVFTDVDGNAVDPVPPTATVEVTRADGTPLVAGDATRIAPGEFTLELSPDDTAQLDLLTAAWTSALGVVETTVEVCGGVFFTIAQARRLRPLGDETAYPSSTIAATRTLVEQALEDACGGVAFVPRYAQETLDSEGGTELLLSRSRVRLLRAATLAGRALDPDELAAIELSRTGRISRREGWPAGLGAVEIAYEHGYPTVPLRVARAALLQARQWLEESPIDERATEVRTEGGVLVLAATEGLDFALPEVNAVVERYAMRHAG